MNEKTDTKKLTGIPETLLVALYFGAAETQRADGIIRDQKAVEMIQNIEYDFARFNKAWASQIGVAVRTEILDKATTAFIRQYPDTTVVIHKTAEFAQSRICRKCPNKLT